jgi:Na+/melibiose symporter-like transporter
MTTQPSLWRHTDFRRLWISETISLVGSQITLFALPLTAVVLLDASAWEMGLLGTLEFLPFLLLSLFAGVWADRLPRRPVLAISNLGRALALGTIPLAAWAGLLTMPYLYVVAVVVGVLTVFFDVAYQAYLPALVGHDHLVEGNSKLEASRSVAQIAGPAGAGWLVQLLGAPIAIALDAASFLVSSLFLQGIRAVEAPRPTAAAQPNMWREIGEGLRLVLGSPILRPIAACTATSNFFGNVQGTVLTIYAVRELGIDAGLLGTIYAVGSAGALLGVFATNAVARRLGVGPTIIATTLLAGIAGFGAPLASGPLAVAVGFLIGWQLLYSFTTPIYNITQVSLRQALTPLRLQGRMNASMRFIVWGTIPLGALAGGALGELIGIRLTLLVGAIGMLFACLWVLFSPVRRIREQPLPDQMTI